MQTNNNTTTKTTNTLCQTSTTLRDAAVRFSKRSGIPLVVPATSTLDLAFEARREKRARVMYEHASLQVPSVAPEEVFDDEAREQIERTLSFRRAYEQASPRAVEVA
jgi:hypothetical protein